MFGGDRIGIYFCEKGASQRPSNVIYDRAGSSAATATRADYDWERILDGASWFHFTGITPALGGENPAIVFDACETAKRKGVTVSCDLNYRKKLWTRERAREVMEKLCGYVDVLIANEEDSADVFGIRAGGSDIEGGRLSAEGYADVARQLTERFGLTAAAITLRESVSASVNGWSGCFTPAGRRIFPPNIPSISSTAWAGGRQLRRGADLFAAGGEGAAGRHRVCRRRFLPQAHGGGRLQHRHCRRSRSACQKRRQRPRAALNGGI